MIVMQIVSSVDVKLILDLQYISNVLDVLVKKRFRWCVSWPV